MSDNQYSNNSENGYPYQPQQEPSYQPPVENPGDMPNPSVYLVLVIIGFLCGILWGALSVSPYKKLKAAVEENNYAEAKANAKKIKTFVIIGVVINVLLIIGKIGQAGAI